MSELAPSATMRATTERWRLDAIATPDPDLAALRLIAGGQACEYLGLWGVKPTGIHTSACVLRPRAMLTSIRRSRAAMPQGSTFYVQAYCVRSCTFKGPIYRILARAS